jgi:hypothetical protein
VRYRGGKGKHSGGGTPSTSIGKVTGLPFGGRQSVYIAVCVESTAQATNRFAC